MYSQSLGTLDTQTQYNTILSRVEDKAESGRLELPGLQCSPQSLSGDPVPRLEALSERLLSAAIYLTALSTTTRNDHRRLI